MNCEVEGILFVCYVKIVYVGLFEFCYYSSGLVGVMCLVVNVVDMFWKVVGDIWDVD